MDKNRKKLFFLMIDALGISATWKGNALLSADTRYFFDLWNTGNHFLLDNEAIKNGYYSQELIHGMISSGKNQLSDKAYLDKAIEDKSLFNEKNLVETYDQAKRRNAAIHLVGSIPSEIGKYSSLSQLISMIKHARGCGINEIYLHLFIDDSLDANQATLSINALEKELVKVSAGEIATIAHMHTLSERNIKNLVKTLVLGSGKKVLSAGQAISKTYAETADRSLPYSISSNNRPVGKICDFDVIFYFDFNDSPIKKVLTDYLSSDTIQFLFKTLKLPNFLSFISFFPSPETENKVKSLLLRKFVKTLPEIISDAGLLQVELADSSRINHFEYFFDGGKKIKGLEKLFLPLDDPFITSDKIFGAATSLLSSGQFDVVYCEFSLLDTLFKSMEFKSAVRALLKIDQYLKTFVELAKKNDWQMVLLSNHGGVEKMGDLFDTEKLNQKTTNPVPFIVLGDANAVKKQPKLSSKIHDQFMYDMMGKRDKFEDVAPTILNILGFPAEKGMEGINLLQNKGLK